MSDFVLIVWILAAFLFDVAILGFTGYRVFYCGNSAWWFAVAYIVGCQPSLFKVLRKRYGVNEQ